MITIFADGASSGNPGPGGWGAIVLDESQQVQELAGGDPHTTNNKMELKAILAALRLIHEKNLPGQSVSIHTDSSYVIQGITQWIHSWKRNGWKTAEGKDVLNRDLWEALSEAAQALKPRKLTWNYVPGHAGIPGNDRVDELAVQESKKITPTLYQGPLSSYGIDLSDLTPRAEALAAKKEKRQVQNGKALRATSSGRDTRAAYYLSVVGANVHRDSTWAECEARVKGVSGARYKKVSSLEEEKETLKSWGVRAD